jgi:GMP reductase
MHALHYKDVVLLPDFSTLSSRADADTSVVLGNHTFKSPVLPSNMKCTIDLDTARTLSTNGYFYIMHRFDVDLEEFVSTANREKWPCVSISIGVNDSDRVVYDLLYDLNFHIDFITVDIAHGHCEKMKDVLSYLQKFKARGVQIIAGNIVTNKAAYDLIKWGADIVKAGIGQGYVCTTKDKTGFTMPMFSCIRSLPVHIPVIADGGIRCNGDVTKALVAGAKMVMCGSMFAKLTDSPSGERIKPSKRRVHDRWFYETVPAIMAQVTENGTRGGVNSAGAAAEGVEPETGAIGGIAILAAAAAEVEVAAPELGLKATAGAVNSAAGVVAEDGGEPEAWATGGFEMLAAGTAKDEKVATELRLRGA